MSLLIFCWARVVDGGPTLDQQRLQRVVPAEHSNSRAGPITQIHGVATCI